jgi:hypothetical protein
MARIERGFETTDGDAREKCLSREGWFVTARASGPGGDDLAFVFSDWARGIEPWRFNLPQSHETRADLRTHTVFDRTLLRAGETVAMKHFLREETERGLALPATSRLPTAVLLTHRGSGAEVLLPLAWPRGARASESQWDSEAAAWPRRGAAAGESARAASAWAFRVPLVDWLVEPTPVPVAPRAGFPRS